MVGNFSFYITFHYLIVEKKQADRGFPWNQVFVHDG